MPQYTVTWTTPALQDLRGIHAYISQDSPANARGVIREIVLSTRMLRDFPYVGHPVTIRRRALRQFVILNHRLIYRVDSHSVTIVAVIHSARLLSKAMRGRPTT